MNLCYRSLEVFHQHGKTHSELLKAQRTIGGCGLGGPLRYPNSIILWLRCNKVRARDHDLLTHQIFIHGEIDINVLLSQTDRMMYYRNNDGTIPLSLYASRFSEHYFSQSVSVSAFLDFRFVLLPSSGNLMIIWTLGRSSWFGKSIIFYNSEKYALKFLIFFF